jgi:hypothetical protein
MDGVAEELLGWLQTESTYYADAMRGRSQRSPFAADASESDKLDYYRRQMYKTNPDGSVQYHLPNYEGRQNLMTRLGVRGYAQVYEAVRPKQGKGRRGLPIEQPEQIQDAGPPVEPPSLSPLMQPKPVPASIPGLGQIQDAGPPQGQ